jgi:hypothetical protein
MMSNRSGVGLVELSVLETLEALTAGRPRAYVTSAEVVSGIEARIGLRPRYGYEVLTDLIRPWIMPVRLVAGWGNFGDRDCPYPAEPEDTRCRPSHVGQLVLDAEAHRLAPVPVGLINGTVYGSGTQPPLEPFRVLAALRRLLEVRRVTDAEVLRIVGPPYLVTDCELTSNLDALIKGRPAAIRQTGRITITGVPVLGPDAVVPLDRRGWTGSEISSRPPRPAHLIIESLPARTSALDVDKAITKQAESHGWYGSGPDRVETEWCATADGVELILHSRIDRRACERGAQLGVQRPLARSSRSASTVRKPRHSRSAAGDQASQLNVQPPSSRWAWARWSRCALMVASSNSARASESGSGA